MIQMFTNLSKNTLNKTRFYSMTVKINWNTFSVTGTNSKVMPFKTYGLLCDNSNDSSHAPRLEMWVIGCANGSVKSQMYNSGIQS